MPSNDPQFVATAIHKIVGDIATHIIQHNIINLNEIDLFTIGPPVGVVPTFNAQVLQELPK
jgi:hypothetical protein